MSFRSLHSIALITVSAAATAVFIQACGGSDAVAQSQPASDVDQIQGVWDATVTSKDCTTGAVLATFKALLVFHRGGTVEVDNAMQRAARSNIYGVWKRSAGSAYSVDVIHQRFNPDATLAGTNKIRRTTTISADGNSFSGPLAVQFFDTNGAVIMQACANETATRVTW